MKTFHKHIPFLRVHRNLCRVIARWVFRSRATSGMDSSWGHRTIRILVILLISTIPTRILEPTLLTQTSTLDQATEVVSTCHKFHRHVKLEASPLWWLRKKDKPRTKSRIKKWSLHRSLIDSTRTCRLSRLTKQRDKPRTMHPNLRNNLCQRKWSLSPWCQRFQARLTLYLRFQARSRTSQMGQPRATTLISWSSKRKKTLAWAKSRRILTRRSGSSTTPASFRKWCKTTLKIQRVSNRTLKILARRVTCTLKLWASEEVIRHPMTKKVRVLPVRARAARVPFRVLIIEWS